MEKERACVVYVMYEYKKIRERRKETGERERRASNGGEVNG
jgi:hypothetical protein